jgi:hypothetical protein
MAVNNLQRILIRRKHLMLLSIKRALLVIPAALARGFEALRTRKSAQATIDWDCLDSLFLSAKRLTITCLGDKPPMGLYVIPWQRTDELTFCDNSLASAFDDVDCLDDIFEAGMLIYAVCWPGLPGPPAEITIGSRACQLAADGFLWHDDNIVGCLVALCDEHQAFAVVTKRKAVE